MAQKFWYGVFTDVDGSFSFKRVQAAVLTILFVSVVVGNMFFHFMLNESILGWLCGLMGYNYTGIAAEKFTNRSITPDTKVVS